jgi:hypothetical protein
MGKQRHLSSTSGTNASTQRADMLDVKECINRLFRSATASHAREGAVSESEMLTAKHMALDTDQHPPSLLTKSTNALCNTQTTFDAGPADTLTQHKEQHHVVALGCMLPHTLSFYQARLASWIICRQRSLRSHSESMECSMLRAWVGGKI